MPWQVVQYVKITLRGAPCGGTTCGLVARPNCAITGGAAVHASTPMATRVRWIRRVTCDIRACLHHLERLQPARARPDLVHLNPIEMQDAEQHVRGPLRVVREDEVAVALERAVDAANEDHR